MKFLIGLILVLMGIYVEAKPQNPKDGELATRISSKYYQTLQSQIADVELGVRLVDHWHAPGKENDAGRVEIFQDGEWQKLCLDKSKTDQRIDNARRNLVKVVCGMLGFTGETEDMTLLPKYFEAEKSGVSKYDYVCTGDEKTIFDCDKSEARCKLDPKKEMSEHKEEGIFWVAANCLIV